MIPIEIPSAMLYISGIAKIVKYAGTASVRSLKSMSTTADSIKNPTKINAGAVAKHGTAVNTGAKKIANKNMIAVTADARPVRPPAPTPAELSTYVVVVEVPITTPTSVPIVSNISTNRKEHNTIIKLRIPTPWKSALKHCPNVSPILLKSVMCMDGYNE